MGRSLFCEQTRGICRVCLLQKGTREIFNENFEAQFRFCTSLEVTQTDGLPRKLCDICTDNMLIAYDFRFQAIHAEKYLRMRFSRNDEIDVDENMQEINILVPDMESSRSDINKNIGMKVPKKDEVFADECLNLLDDSDYVINCPQENFVEEKDSDYKSLTRTPGKSPNNFWNTAKEVINLPKNTGNNIIQSTERIDKNRKSSKIDCNICGMHFTQINSFKRHLINHSGDRPFSCEFCKKTFSRRTVLNIHRRLHTGERPYGCDECIETFITKEAMNRHIFRYHSNSKCHKVIDSNDENYVFSEISCHYFHAQSSRQKLQCSQSVVGKKNLPIVKFCKTCHLSFSSIGELESHRKIHIKEDFFKCTICHQSFEKKYQLLLHLQTHENDKKLIKNYTLRLQKFEKMESILPVTDNNSSLPRSIKKNWKCEKCKTFFSNSTILKTHLRKHLIGTKQPCVCESCGKTFQRSNILRIHRSIHNSIDRPQCSEDLKKTRDAWLINRFGQNCEKTSIASANNDILSKPLSEECIDKYKYIQVKNNKETKKPSIWNEFAKKFVCEQCCMEFGKKHEWMFHLELHNNQTIFCKKCGAFFLLKEELLKHIKSKHFDKRNLDFQCPDCYENLYDMRDLKLHLFEFHGIPVKDLDLCFLCDIAFKSVKKYYKHVFEKHDNINKFCNECNEHFDSRKTFEKHVRAHYI